MGPLPWRILVLADTHNKLPTAVAELAREADEIWHLGDVCNNAVLQELRLLGPPVTLVRGNCDGDSSWPVFAELTKNGIRFRLQHIPPGRRERVPECDVLLHGHTHVPRDEMVAGVRVLNPGCVTRPNRGAPQSVAWLEFQNDGSFEWKLVGLRRSS